MTESIEKLHMLITTSLSSLNLEHTIRWSYNFDDYKSLKTLGFRQTYTITVTSTTNIS